jgi:hypothetical protein
MSCFRFIVADSVCRIPNSNGAGLAVGRCGMGRSHA